MLFFHAENFFVILCGLVEIFDVNCDMPDPRFFHISLRLVWVFFDLEFSLGHFSSSREFFPSPARHQRDRARKDPATLLPHPAPSALSLPSRTPPKTAETYR